MTPTDKASDYFCFRPENASLIVANPSIMRQFGRTPPSLMKHRLGSFPAIGVGERKYTPAYPRVIVAHVPVWSKPAVNGVDPTAEDVAKYLSNPPENNPASKWWNAKKPSFKIASVHACSDTDSFVQMLPADCVVYGCGNTNLAQCSWEIEMKGKGTEKADYWLGPEGTLILQQSARALIESLILSFGTSWKFALPPLKYAKLTAEGNPVEYGFCQHRDVPYWGKGKWNPYPDNLKVGQHADIGEDFPMDYWFQLIAQIMPEY